MRLFRFGLWLLLFALGCKKEEAAKAGALRVDLSYATFRPGCLTLKVEDKADSSRSQTQQLQLGDKPASSKTLTVAVFRKQDWSHDLMLTATAYERSCSDAKPVITQTLGATVPETGVQAVTMALRADDLDDDGYVKASEGGTDCDDNDSSVHPGATELCNGKDDNCSGDEADAPGTITYYVDADHDGYGDPAQGQLSCAQVAGRVAQGGDCDDTNPAVHPGQPETLCDGKDENCNDAVDDTFSAGASCDTSLGCPGTYVCNGDKKGSQCVSSQVPVAWYVDSDGDGHAGTPAGLGCVPPVAGAVQTQDDCDDSSPFIKPGATERCDRLDNNCDGNVDDASCSGVDWHLAANTNTSEWLAVASYSEGRAWVAGLGGALALVQSDTASSYADCSGEWISAWASPTTGRVFLGSNDGKLATHAVTGGVSCSAAGENADTGRTASINGLMGFESSQTITLFAVTSEGRIFRWTYPGGGAPTQLTQVSANLRSIHGTSPTNLLAVGVQANKPVAFHTNPDGTWSQETLPNGLPDGYLRGVYMVHAQLAYAAGDQGMVLERSSGTWRTLPAPGTTPSLVGIRAYGRTSLHSVSNSAKNVYLFNGTAWQQDQSVTWTPRAIDGVGPQDLWVVGSQGKILHRAP